MGGRDPSPTPSPHRVCLIGGGVACGTPGIGLRAHVRMWWDVDMPVDHGDMGSSEQATSH